VPVRFSYYLNPQTPSARDDGRVIEEVFGQLDLVDSLGFSDVWVTDHQFTGYNAYSDPTTMAAAISQRAPNLRIGLAVAVAPLMHPIRFVTQCNLIDQLTKGRFIVGIGPGNSPDEFAGYGVDVEARHSVLREFIEVCERAWAMGPDDEDFEYEGKHFQCKVRGRIIPSPVQQPPHIAFASSTPERLAAGGGRGWSLLLGPQTPEVLAGRLYHYFRGMDEAKLDKAARDRAWEHTSVLRQIYVAEEGENWQESLADVLDTYARKSLRANTGIDDLPKEDMEKRKQQYLKSGWLYAGTADEVFERLRPFAELGVSNLLCWVNFGHMEDARVRASLQRFADDVMPRLQAITPTEGLLDSLVEQNATPLTAPAVP
jgi:alkanesulfonate monooxygenase SsuD/methylene tetrahydromethanopterin reductase-like flavin-dependent oxidoreductase (luciferase family)